MTAGYWQAGAIDSPPSLSTLSSKGYPTSGNPKTGTPATKPGAAWFYLMDQMRISVIDACGMTQVEPPSITQFLEALQSFKWTKAGALDGAALKTGSVKEAHLAARSVTAQKLATPLDLKGGGVALQLKGYTTAELAQVVLDDRELAINTETYGLYAGDGKTKGGHLVGGSVAQEVEEIKQILTMLTQAVAKVSGEDVSIGG